MQTFYIRIREPIPQRRGFVHDVLAIVEVYEVDGGWVWRQVDEEGYPIGEPEQTFFTEDSALSNAVKQLGGVGVELAGH